MFHSLKSLPLWALSKEHVFCSLKISLARELLPFKIKSAYVPSAFPMLLLQQGEVEHSVVVPESTHFVVLGNTEGKAVGLRLWAPNQQPVVSKTGFYH